MAQKNKGQIGPRRVTGVLAITLAGLAIWAGCQKRPTEQNQTDRQNDESTQPNPVLVAKPNEPGQENPKETVAVTPASAKLTMDEIIAARKHWGPIYTTMYGKPAPDFTLTDITGKQHKLSDYRGKNVMIVFTTTWCPPCRMTVPHLIELRRAVSGDNLAILAVYYITTYPPHTAEIIRHFAATQKLNYTVFAADPGTVGAPYNSIDSIPTIFFVDPEGKIKLVATGLVMLDEMKAILQAG
jgi:peroxiredoxin